MKTKNAISLSLVLGTTVCWLNCPASLNAQTVRLHGAVTLSKLISDQKAALETQTGLKLEIVGNGSGRGLAALAGGEAEIAMLAGSVKGVAAAMNKEKPGSVDIAGLKDTPLPGVKLAFVIHPSAGVKSLTEAQVRDLLSGKAARWKDAGGADVPVKVVLPFAGDGARVTVQEVVLNGADFAKDAILRNSSKDIPAVIKQLPGSISFLSERNAEGLTTVGYEKDLQMPLLLVTKGDPAGDVKKVVDSVKGALK